MRDTIIGFLVVIGIMGGYAYLKRDVSQVSPSPVIAANQSVKPTNKSKGEKHERANRKSEGARSRVEGLPSIYASQKARQPEPESIEEALEESSGPERAPERTKVLHGVPVQAWIASKKNTMNTDVPDPKVGSGVRVFVNCLELKAKTGASYSERECSELLARRSAPRRLPYQ